MGRFCLIPKQAFMTDIRRMDFLEGQGTALLDFSDLDMRYFLKLRSHIAICMPPVFLDLERTFDMAALRDEGVQPIMYCVKLESAPVPLAFGSDLISEHRIGIFRHGASGSANGAERLLLDSRAVFKAHRGSGDPRALGLEKEKGALEEVGRAEVLQVFTRPLAPRGERGVSEVPEPLRALRVHPWEEPYPDLAGFEEIPPGFEEAPPSPLQEFTSVWGYPNTDINQHVNVLEYIGGMENQFTRLVHARGLSPQKHFIRHAALIFRKPFFPGEPYGLRGRLWVSGRRTLLVGTFHNMDPEGRMADGANIAARYEGELEDD
jgi:hypothetical protein